MIKEVKERFMAGLQDGICPECGMRYTEMYKYVGTYYEEES